MARVGEHIVVGGYYALLWWGLGAVLSLSRAGDPTSAPPLGAVVVVAVGYGVGMTLDVGGWVRRRVGQRPAPTDPKAKPDAS